MDNLRLDEANLDVEFEPCCSPTYANDPDWEEDSDKDGACNHLMTNKILNEYRKELSTLTVRKERKQSHAKLTLKSGGKNLCYESMKLAERAVTKAQYGKAHKHILITQGACG
jgi:hypothetical protein